jgi:hypothetical protein
VELVTNRAGRPRQPLRGAARGAIFIKEILGENQGTCIKSNKNTILKKNIFIIKHIKKTRIFLKKKKENK